MQQSTILKAIGYIVTLLVAVVLGIWPGIALAQTENWILFGGILGWFTFPLVLINVLAGSNYATLPYLILAACGYPLAMLGYSIYAYQAMKHMTKEKVMLMLFIAAGVSALVSLPVDAITRSIIHSQDILTNETAGTVATYVFVLIQMITSAALGWLIAFSRQRRNKNPVGDGRAPSPSSPSDERSQRPTSPACLRCVSRTARA